MNQSMNKVFLERLTNVQKQKLSAIIKLLLGVVTAIRICTVPRVEHGPKMFLLFSPLIDEKISSFLTYLKSWWKVVLVFGKEHANWSNISGVMIGWSWKIKFGKINQNDNGLDFSTSSYHNSTNTRTIDMFFTKKCIYFSQETRWNPFLSQSQRKVCNCTIAV